MTNLTRSLCQIIADEIAGEITSETPVYLQRRDEKVKPPFVVVALDEFTPTGTGDQAGIARINVVLATDAYTTTVDEHSDIAAEVDVILTSMERRGKVFGHNVRLLGMTIMRSSYTKTSDDARSMTRGNIWELVAGASKSMNGIWDDESNVLGEFTSQQALSGGRLVYVSESTVNYANAQTAKPAMGFIKTAVTSSSGVKVYTEGVLSGLVGLTPETDYYLGSNGQITTTPSTSAGIIQFVGRSLTQTSILVEIDSPIIVQ
ncbi:hypothetical protein EBZ80_12930 [bacterium]|nr:hypothetical protein [bacterium]